MRPLTRINDIAQMLHPARKDYAEVGPLEARLSVSRQTGATSEGDCRAGGIPHPPVHHAELGVQDAIREGRALPPPVPRDENNCADPAKTLHEKRHQEEGPEICQNSQVLDAGET